MSSNVRHSAKRDANEQEIVDYLRAAGCSVDRLNGTGVPDLLVGYNGNNILLEVKMPGKGLNKAQEKWHSEFNGSAWVVETIEDAHIAISGYVNQRVINKARID